ncbi:MAG: beta-1,6-N-acetylglucosaminyltransferase [Candidatus Saccharimonadaceae bacterium]
MSNPSNKPRIAFLVLSHGNPTQLNIFINQLLRYEGSFIFVHIDKKSTMQPSELCLDSRVIILKDRISVSWGDFSQIQAILNLIESAFAFGVFDYFSLHSGADLAVKPIKDFAEYLVQSKIAAFLECESLPIDAWGHGGGGYERIALKYPLIFRAKVGRKHLIRYLRAIYQLSYEKGFIKGTHLPREITFHGGSLWFTVNSRVMDAMTEYIAEHSEYLRIFENSLTGDEIFFNTLIMQVTAASTVEERNNLRYIDWTNSNTDEAGSPKLLMSADKKLIDDSDAYFARKFNSEVDNKIVEYYKDKA